MIEQCSRCRFWREEDATRDTHAPGEHDIEFGFCRRNAPVVIGELAALMVPRTAWGRDQNIDEEELSTTQIYRASTQPVTESADWCGQFEQMGR